MRFMLIKQMTLMGDFVYSSKQVTLTVITEK